MYTANMNNVSKTGYGVDVSARRADDLDKLLLEHVAEHLGCRVLDLGCGAGGAAARLTQAGARVIGVDQHDFGTEWSLIEDVQFIISDIPDFVALVEEKSFDVCLLQRTIHYLPYGETLVLLKDLRTRVDRLYISFSGLTSEIGRAYVDKNKKVEERFCNLESDAQETFGITAPLCLYTENEAVELLEKAGWKIDWVRTSDFGNIKIVAV